ncbi:zealexin A1 synthase-like [Panicum virgatum]|uniref:Uncharacterized protein n=1 Tax=Panicum virgatum TaxID=38727 RepID=A0A8T0WPZ7_PANVG|nr:zealexin A1 synthase-like [Panicum virgatum]KAG2651681.1 hypothetical protein PVAP13_1NG304500 [Panicum virgatum]
MEDKLLLAVAAAVVLIVLSWRLIIRPSLAAKPKLNLPPGPWMLPVIGSLHHLVSSPLLFRVLRGLAKKHGPLMTLRFGEVPALVASSMEAAQAILKVNDTRFADRFAPATSATITYGATNLILSPYGERWRQLRKIVVQEMLTTTRVQSFKHIRQEEVARFLQGMAAAAANGTAVDFSTAVSKLVNDTFLRECVGSRCKYQDEFLDAVHTASQLASGITIADLYPSSRIMQMLGTAPRKGLACRQRIDRILRQIIQEAKEAMECDDKTAHESFVSLLLRLQKDGSMPIPLTNETIIALMFDMLAAGSDTSSTILNWAMTELIRSPTAMARAQAEVRQAFKGKSIITDDDMAKSGISYLKLVFKETLRLHPTSPLLIPRQCRETCQVMGYDIPKGTAVFVNVWAIGRDPSYWEDAEDFKPERFETNNLDFRGTNFEFIPFGAGRRMCPGINLGLANIELALASLLYHFDWKLPKGMEPKDVDMREVVGMVASKETSLTVHPITFIPPAVV